MNFMATNYIKNMDVLRAHILSKYPNEAGGLVDKDDIYHPVENISTDPLNEFTTEPMDLSNVKCIVHSHTYNPKVKLEFDPRVPTKVDMLGQVDTDVEWAIVVCEGENVTEPYFWGDHDHRPPLMGREFISSMQDCLAFVTDWMYVNMGVKMALCPRDPDWFEQGQDLLGKSWAPWGFVEVKDAPRKGDIVMYKISSNQINHLSVFIDDKNVSHHLFKRMPRTESYNVWEKSAFMRVRHHTLM